MQTGTKLKWFFIYFSVGMTLLMAVLFLVFGLIDLVHFLPGQ